MSDEQKPRNIVGFGWGAPPMKEQHQALSNHDAAHFDLDNAALTRLSARGYLTWLQRERAAQKINNAIARSIRAVPAKREGK